MTYPRLPCRFIRILGGGPVSQRCVLLIDGLLIQIKFYGNTRIAVKSI